MSTCKIWWRWTISGQIIAYFWFQYGGRPPSWILNFRTICQKIQISAYLYVDKLHLVKIGRSAAELLHIFDFQYGGSPPCWIWYDVIADHPRFVFDGPINILLKLHVDRVILIYRAFLYSARLAWNCIGPILFTPLGGDYLGILPPKWIPILSQTPKGQFLDENTSYEP